MQHLKRSLGPVLLVDDDHATLLFLKTWLERNGVRVFTAHSVSAAKDIIANNPLALVTTDLRMPNEDGFALIQWCHQHHPKLPLVIVSSYSRKSLKTPLDIPNMIGHFTKPIREAECECLMEWIRDAAVSA